VVAREFIDGLGRNADADVVTRGVIDLARALGLLAVAEGVETPHQHRHVAELGCDFAAGGRWGLAWSSRRRIRRRARRARCGHARRSADAP
jgi:EAL domain-containing protein (putative c-di-GMP-specific phosphodiesterase class I)